VRAIGGHQLVGRAGQLVGALELEQPPQLAQRRGVVLDPQVDPRAPRLALGRHHEQGRRLAAAHVAALRLRGVERGHQARRQVAVRGLERGGHRRRHGLALHHVRLRGVVLAGDVAGERDAVRARVRGDLAARVDDPHLAHARRRVVVEQRLQRLGRAGAGGEPVEPVRPVRRLDDRLRGDRAHAGPRPRTQRADGEPVRVHGGAELARARVERDDRVRAVAHRGRE
jgi:hypothetical protein